MTTDQRIQFENQGFLHLQGVIPPDLASRVRRAMAAASTALEPGAGFRDIRRILDVDECFVDLVDSPGVIAVLMEAIGADLQLNHTLARIEAPGVAPPRLQSDLDDVVGIDLAHSPHFFVKVQFCVEHDEGEIALLPGSHRRTGALADAGTDLVDPLRSPAVVRVSPRVGDALVFNANILHAAMDNPGGRPRTSLIYAYSHFWVKHYGNAVPTDLDRFATTDLRRQLFGVEAEGISYLDIRFDPSLNLRSTNFDSLRAASQRLIRRLRSRGPAAAR